MIEIPIKYADGTCLQFLNGHHQFFLYGSLSNAFSREKNIWGYKGFNSCFGKSFYHTNKPKRSNLLFIIKL